MKTKKVKKIFVTMTVTAQYTFEEEVSDNDSIEDMLSKANERFFEADFGDAEDIDGEVVTIEDEKGNCIYENE